jgi:hypothetical protein
VLAYLAQGKLHLSGDGAPATIESSFGRSLRERAIQIHNRHAWKTQGRSAQFMRGMLWPAQEFDPTEFRIAITSVARGREPRELFYSLETDEISGIFAVDSAGVERRIFHTADFRVRHLALASDGTTMALSVVHNPMIANLALVNVEGADFNEVSEGDSMDLAARWVPGSARRLVYQSAGVGRDAAGGPSKLGPFAVQELDLDSGAVESLAEDSDHDLLAPQKAADGALYYIQRPYAGKKRPSHPLDIVTDTLMFPFRLSYAIFQFFNFFSMRYTGRPLSTSRGAAQRMPDLKQMMIWGNMVDVSRAAREDQLNADAPSLVPSSWQLMRQVNGSKELVAKNVLSFDLAQDGSIFYSNGSAVHRTGPGGKERILVGSLIEQVTAL